MSQLGATNALPTILKSEEVYAGRLVKVRRDEIQFPGGQLASREVVEITDAVAIVAIDSRSRVCLLRHYRHPQRAYVWEVPAGRLDTPDEQPLVTAKRELLEEAGLVAEHWTPLIVSISSAGFATERTHIFLATGVRSATVPEDLQPSAEEQHIQRFLRPIDEVISDIKNGELADAKTVIGVLLADANVR